MTDLRPAAPAPAPQPALSPAEAERQIAQIAETMDSLLGTIERETELVRAGKLREATALEPTKTELSRRYLVDTGRIRDNRGILARAAPERLAALRKQHDLFRALLQMNLTVLATAHAVSESIMRGVSEEMARKATPNGYGASGRASTPGVSGRQPLAVSRVL